MAADAVASDVEVVKVGRDPRRGRVAVIAIIAAADVVRIFANSCNAVMTGSARAEHLRVIDGQNRNEHAAVMAVLAHVARLDVRGTLTRCVYAVMAADAIVNDAAMIEDRRLPRDRRMAIVTLVAGRNVVWRLASCLDTVVTTLAVTGYRRMVHVAYDRPICRDMTVRAFAIRRDMAGGL